MQLLVTGAAGYFGRAILPTLAADPAITGIVATDLAPPGFTHPKLRFERRDLVQDGAEDLLEGMDAAIHLAFVVERRRPGLRSGGDYRGSTSFSREASFWRSAAESSAGPRATRNSAAAFARS